MDPYEVLRQMSKIQKVNAKDDVHSQCHSQDPIIGLDVRGKLFYTHKSTLLSPSSSGSYFDIRFNGEIEPGSSRVDDYGRIIYFIDRSSDLFDHILKFLTEGGRSWPTFQQDEILWKRLYKEADFYQLEDLISFLKTTYNCPYDPSLSYLSRGQGILYWLGTKYGQSEEYTNPADRGMVTVQDYGECMRENISSFFQYRPLRNEWTVAGGEYPSAVPEEYLHISTFNETPSETTVNRHRNTRDGDCSIITFKSIRIRPSHFSLRYGEWDGTNVFNFEGSVDKKSWITLCKVRPNVNGERMKTVRPSLETIESYRNDYEKSDKTERTISEREYWTYIAEKNHREVWQIEPSAVNDFYRHFRIVSIGSEEFNALQDEIRDLAIAKADNPSREEIDWIRDEMGSFDLSIDQPMWQDTMNFWNDHRPRNSICGVGFEIYGDVCQL